METFNYTLVPQLIGATNYTGTNLSISGNISAANANISGTLTIAGTLNTNLSETITNLIQINISASSTNITNATVVSMVVTSNLIATNNSNTLGNLFMTGGNVGINTASPLCQLNVQADASGIYASDSGQVIISGQTNPLKRLGLMIDTTNNVGIIQAGFNGISIYNIALNPAGSNVGIGTTSPGYLLDVNGNARINNNLMFNTAVNNNLGINFPNTGYGLHWGNGYSRIYDDGDLRICTDDNMHFYTGSNTTSPGTERITIIPSGNVGIGTITPQYTLDINGTMRLNQGFQTSNKLLVLGDNNSGDSLTSATNFYGFGINSNTLRYQVPSNTSQHVFYAGSQSSMIITGSGQSMVTIKNYNGNSSSDWPNGWKGALSAYDISCASVYGNAIVTRSDERKKTEIKDINYGLKEVLNMRPVSYRWRDNLGLGEQYGFIAQEIEPLIPEVIVENDDGIKSMKDMYGPLLVNAIRELDDNIENMMNRLEVM